MKKQTKDKKATSLRGSANAALRRKLAKIELQTFESWQPHHFPPKLIDAVARLKGYALLADHDGPDWASLITIARAELAHMWRAAKLRTVSVLPLSSASACELPGWLLDEIEILIK